MKALRSLICLFLLCAILVFSAGAETATVSFDGMFSLQLPADWVALPAEDGAQYSLCNADGSCRMLVEITETDCADTDALSALISETYPEGEKIKYTYGDAEFVIFDLADSDASCAATLLNGNIVNLVFTPRSNADFMASAITILTSFRI